MTPNGVDFAVLSFRWSDDAELQLTVSHHICTAAGKGVSLGVSLTSV